MLSTFLTATTAKRQTASKCSGKTQTKQKEEEASCINGGQNSTDCEEKVHVAGNSVFKYLYRKRMEVHRGRTIKS